MSTGSRTQRRSTPSTRRFAGTTQRTGRTGTAGRPRAVDLARRRKPQKSSKSQGLQALTGLLAGKKAAKSSGKGAKAGAGAAMLTAAAGLAFKNRDKLTAMLKGRRHTPDTDAASPPAGTTGHAVHPPATTSMDSTATEMPPVPPRDMPPGDRI